MRSGLEMEMGLEQEIEMVGGGGGTGLEQEMEVVGDGVRARD